MIHLRYSRVQRQFGIEPHELVQLISQEPPEPSPGNETTLAKIPPPVANTDSQPLIATAVIDIFLGILTFIRLVISSRARSVPYPVRCTCQGS